MSDGIELLAILLSGFLPQIRRARDDASGTLPANDNRLSPPEAEPDPTTERPTAKLLRLLGRSPERPSAP